MFLGGAVLLPLISLSLSLRGFRNTQKALQRFLSSTDGFSRPAELSESASRTAQMVRAAGRYTTRRTTCLEESLATWWLLGRQGIASSVRIGTRKAGGQFEAHAWVECAGIALNEDAIPHRHYAAFDAAFPSLPTAGS